MSCWWELQEWARCAGAGSRSCSLGAASRKLLDLALRCLQLYPADPSPRLLPLPVCRSFANAHTYHINSIALSSDCETFISADDLRVNLWHLDRWASWCPCCLCWHGMDSHQLRLLVRLLLRD